MKDESLPTNDFKVSVYMIWKYFKTTVLQAHTFTHCIGATVYNVNKVC